jgi:hypothetical protein
MTQIKEYVLLLIGACLVCGGLTILAPGGRFERMMQVIGSIFLLLCMLSPLTETISKLLEYKVFSDYEYSYQETCAWDYSSNVMCRALETEINHHVVTVLGHEAQDVEIGIDHNNNNFSLARIFITVSKEDYAKKTAISDYVFMKTGERPTVISREVGE